MNTHLFPVQLASLLNNLLMVVLILIPEFGLAQPWVEDWEGNWPNNWHSSAGTWTAGIPATGPGEAYDGLKCAATVPEGNYAESVESWFIRHTPFTIPSDAQNPRLRFWHWYSFSSGDFGEVHISTDGMNTWEVIPNSNRFTNTSSGIWSYPLVDLSPYKGQTVHIAFYFKSQQTGPFPAVSSGWYIDNMAFITGPLTFNMFEGFEDGIGDWAIDRGSWEIGNPTSGPNSTFEGDSCIATVLAGNYAESVDSRIKSPGFAVTGENASLRFWHWYSFSSGDYGEVQIKRLNDLEWDIISPQFINTSSSEWTNYFIPLTDYINETVQIAFYFQSRQTGPFPAVSSGWYIDGITITGEEPLNEICNDGIDNDNDGLIDCEDPDCSFVATISVDNNSNLCVNDTISLLASPGNMTYNWSGPNGFDSTIQNPQITNAMLVDAGTYSVTVTNANGCTAEDSTNVTVTATCDTTATIIIGENEGVQGSVIEIPIMITGCESLISAQWTLQLLEPGIASFVDIVTAPDLNSTNAPQFNPDTGAFSFLSLSEDGLQFVDGDTVFILSVLLTGAPGDMSDLTLSTNPLSIELGCLANGEPTTVDASVTIGKVSILDVISMTGQVYAYNNVGMENVEVTLAGMAADGTSLDQITNTDQNGNYTFPAILAGSTFDIACTKFADYRNGLSTFELYIGQQYILGLSPSLISNAYQVVAGDANCTNSFTVADIVIMQRLLVGLIDDFSGPCPSWEFIPDSFTFPTNFTINNVFPYSTTAHFDAAVQDAVMNFRGIKKGDIIESANPQGLTELDERTVLSMFLEDQSINAGEIFEIPFLLEDFRQLSGFQFSLQFDTDYLNFVEVVSSPETQNPTLLVGDSRVQEGELLFSQIGIGAQVEENNGRKELLRLRFQAKKDKTSIKKLLYLTDQIATQVFNTDLELYPLNIQFSDHSLESPRVLNLQPNPTKQFTQLLIHSPEQMQIHATLFNTFGSEIKRWSFISQAGNNNFELFVDDLSAGTYFLKLYIGDHSEVKKLLIFH